MQHLLITPGEPELPDIGVGCANALTAGIPEMIEVAARHGFRRITVRPRAFAEALRQGWTVAALRRRLVSADVEVTMIDALWPSLPGIPDPASIDPALPALQPLDVLEPPDEETCFRAAEALGATIVNVTHYLGSPLPLERMADAVGNICRRAAARGLRVAIEPVPGTGLLDLASTQAVVDACGEPNCGITLDLFHLDRSGGSLEDVRRLREGALLVSRSAIVGRHRRGASTFRCVVASCPARAACRCATSLPRRSTRVRARPSTSKSSTTNCGRSGPTTPSHVSRRPPESGARALGIMETLGFARRRTMLHHSIAVTTLGMIEL